MARAHSLDLRQRIVGAVEDGLSRRAAATRFAVSQSCAIKLLQRWKDTGSVAPAVPSAKKAFALAPHEKLVRSLIAASRTSRSPNCRRGWPMRRSWWAVRRSTVL